MAGERSASDRLRQAIDHGETGDKVDFIDPAAAPLGTDAEAGGTPTDGAALARETQASSGADGQATSDQTADAPRTPKQLERGHFSSVWLMVIVGVVVVIGALMLTAR